MTFVSLLRSLHGIRGVLAVGSVVAAAALSGCASGEYSYVKTTAYGERLTFPLERGQPQWASKDGITIWAAGLLPTGDPEKKEVFFGFGFTDESGVAPIKVRIEDVSDDKPIVVFEDDAPTLGEGNTWRSEPKMLKAGDPKIAWTSYVGDTFRVYRFVITKPGGREVVLHQAISVPAWMKASMRKALGIG